MGRLFWKFFFSFLLVLIMVGAGVGTTVWVHQQESGGPFKDIMGGYRTAFMVRVVADVLNHDHSPQFVSKILDMLKNDQNVPQVYIVDEHQKEIFNRFISPVTFEHAQTLIKSHFEPQIVRKITLDNGREYILFVPKDAHSFESFKPNPPPSSPFTIPIFFGMVASLACSTFLALYFSKPVRYLRWALDAFSAGNLNIRVSPLMNRQRDEIADLGQHFDNMAQKIQLLIASQQRLLHDVSHELRSPLARIQAAIGLLRKQPHTLEQALTRLEHEVERFDELVGELLTLSRLESGIREHSDEYFDLVVLIQAIVDDARFEAAAKKHAIEFSLQGEILLSGSAKLLYRAIENVIRNAIKYTPPDSTVSIIVEQPSDEHVLVVIADAGFGIPEKDLESVFQPFIRGSAESAHPQGYGLGLAIARRAVEAHGGHIYAQNREQGGLKVSIVLPIFRPERLGTEKKVLT